MANARSGRSAPPGGYSGDFDEHVRASIGKTIQALEGWFQNNVSASQTNVVLDRAAYVAAATAFSTTKWVSPGYGSVVLVWVKSNAARTAGTLTIEVMVNGAGTGLKAVLNGTNTLYHRIPTQEATVRFSPGDELQVRITTDGSWAPTTADIVAGARVVLN